MTPRELLTEALGGFAALIVIAAAVWFLMVALP